MKAILVSVEYGDILSITLPRNRHHFDEVMVVTTPCDEETIAVAKSHDARLHLTESFYTNGAIFNKWIALEEGLDALGRSGLMCIMDADIVWPKQIDCEYKKGFLYTPRRRISPVIKSSIREEFWYRYPTKKDVDWPGYTQIFYADDPHLPPAPWHELDWIYAAGADSTFQRLWPKEEKIKPNWKVLHLGPTASNWCGRVTPRLDGKAIPEARDRKKLQNGMLKHCQMAKRTGDVERIVERIRRGEI